jgi:hypothetical protein
MSASAASSGSAAQSQIGENMTAAMIAFGNAATGTVKVAAKALDNTVQVVDKTVDVAGKTAIDTVETAGVVAEAALGVTRKAATSAREISETALQTSVNVTKAAGTAVSATTKAAANITKTASTLATETAKTAARTAIKAQKDAEKIAAAAGDLAGAAAASASELGQAAAKASAKTGTAALDAGSAVSVAALETSKETAVKGLDLVKTTLATSADLTKDLANNTIKGVHNMFNIISSAGARYAEKVKTQQSAAMKSQEAFGLTKSIKDQLRSELLTFSGEFTKSVIAFKGTQLESLTVLQAILRNEYCLGKMSGLTRLFTKRCPPKANSESVSKQLKIYIDQNETRSKNIMLKVNSLIKAFEVNHINLINFTQSDPNEMINNFKIRMDELMTTLANFTKEIQQIYQKTIDWVQSMIDKRMNSVLSAYNTPSANNKGPVEPVAPVVNNGPVASSENATHNNRIGNKPSNTAPMIAMGGKRRTSRSRVAKKRKHRTIRHRRN